MKLLSGVYIINNLVNGKVYIGSSTFSAEGRVAEHFKSLRKGNHISKGLQADWNRYGANGFDWRILIRCLSDRVLFIEQTYLDKYKSYLPEKGYNFSPTAGTTKGTTYGADVRAKLSASIKAAHARPEVKAKRAAVFSSPEYKARHAEAMKKVTESEEYRSNMSKSVKAALSNEGVRKKISEGVKKAYRENPEILRKVVEAVTGRKHSEETLQKMRDSNTDDVRFRKGSGNRGKKLPPVSEETRQKMSEAAKARRAKER